MRAPRRLALALALLAAAAGCGYRVGLVPRDAGGRGVEQLGIEIFGNDSRMPDLERDLHASMSRAARRWVDARLVRPEAAPLVLRGRITVVESLPGIRSGENRVLESIGAVRVEAELFDRATRAVVRSAETYVRVGTNLDVPDAGVDARARAVDVAADRLVLLLLAREDEASLPPTTAEPSPAAEPNPGAEASTVGD